MGGTGGNFLCHFISSAKRNIKDIIPLSEHGNSHEFGIKDIDSFSRGIAWPDKDKVDFLFSQLPKPGAEKPYYVNCHILDINMINANFKKSIRIVYDEDDISEITNVFYGKWFIDTQIGKSVPIYKKESYALGMRYRQRKFLKMQDMPNVLFISWKEYFKGNIDDFIEKLSTFTNINIENFSKESLIHWRKKTQECINKFSD